MKDGIRSLWDYEPRGWPAAAANLLVAVLCLGVYLYLGFGLGEWDNGFFLLIAVAFLIGAVAELLPKERMSLASTLRLVVIGLALVLVALFFTQPAWF